MQFKALAIGRFAGSALRRAAGPWEIIASFEKATYLSSGSEVVVVTARQVPRGPLYVTVDSDDVLTHDGAAVASTADRLEFGRHSVSLPPAEVWSGALPDGAALATRQQAIIDMLAPLAKESALAAEPFSRPAGDGIAKLQQRDIHGIAGFLAGLGPGFTPAGDDALAGLLLTEVATGRLTPGDWSIDREAAQRTSLVSLAFIRCAAAGQAIAPVHDVLMAGAAGDGAACRAACEELQAVGGTSGADIAFGMRAALAHHQCH